MKSDALQILRAVRDGHPVNHLVTVVRTEGSCYRKPGARLGVADGKVVAGSVSGGCVDPGLALRAAWHARSGPRLLRLETTTGSDPEDLGVGYPGCGGTLSVLVDPAPAAVLSFLERVRSNTAPGVIVTCTSATGPFPLGTRAFFLRSEGARLSAVGGSDELADASASLASAAQGERRSFNETLETPTGRQEVFVEHVPPPTELVVMGRHHDVSKVVELAALMEWSITVMGPRALQNSLGGRCTVLALDESVARPWLEAHRDAHVVVMTHSVSDDRAMIRAIAQAGVRGYVGLLGPRSRRDEVFDPLRDDPTVPADVLDRVHAPAGLALGGDGPDAIALSLVSGIQTHIHGAR